MDTETTALGYQATRRGNDLTIHRVPIFVECDRGEVNFDGVWIATAVAKAMQAEQEGYYPPLHIRHHEPSTDANDSVRAAGYFQILGTETITFKGSRRVAIMADLVITDPATQQEVLNKRLPYRSVEIFNVEKPSIDGLALLDHEAPFLELPMLMISEVDGQRTDSLHALGNSDSGNFRESWFMESRRDDEPAVACFRHGNKAHLLFREELTVNKTKTKTRKKVLEDVKNAQPMNFGGDDDKPKEENNYEKNGDDNGDDEDMENGGYDVAGVVSAIESGEISVADMDSILAAIQAQQSESTTEEEEAPEEAAPAAVPGESMKNKSLHEQFASMQGENESLRADIDTMKADALRKEQVAESMLRLGDRPLGADLEERLISFHSDHGAKAFTAYVDGLAKTTGILPGDNGTGNAFQSQLGKTPEVAMKYQEQGTDAIDTATAFAREWEELRNSGHTRMTQDRYVEINMTTPEARS